MELTFEQAMANGDRSARWPKREPDSRLEPECWPVIKPSFQFEQGAPVFTIGSCFARNVEAHLATLGFSVPALDFLARNAEDFGPNGREILNKYTPPSIYQELSWTRRILDRDDTVSEADIEPFLLALKNGNVIDLQRRFIAKQGITHEEALRQRRNFYNLFKQAFESPIFIITLGLVEAWYDTERGQYVEFSNEFMRAKERFVFRRLDYPECYDYIRKSIELVNGSGPRKILITTSPVPLGRTFTPDDAIVANTYSKSVLRAVAGKIAEEFDNVDYFPSYESVTLTRQNGIWEDDLIHIHKSFISRIMSRVVSGYVAGHEAANDPVADKILRFDSLVRNRRMQEARALYDQIEAEPKRAALPQFRLAAARMFAETGAREQALGLAMAVLNDLERRARVSPPLAYECYCVFDKAGDTASAERAKSLMFKTIAEAPITLRPLFSRAVLPNGGHGIEMICEHVAKRHADQPEMVKGAARLLCKFADRISEEGHHDRAASLKRLAERLFPDVARVKKPPRAA